MCAQTIGHVGGQHARDTFAFEVAYIQQLRSHSPNLQCSNSFTVNKHVTAVLREFSSIPVSDEETDLIPPALRKILHTICLCLSMRDLNLSANLRLSHG